ncbi:hypothetical protein GGX14DRAFT_471032 [Mycena pura]|uniref:Uncharacterized protein n=1 Tax=Mycena pura TaxID=153505 RepID=A0AAD6V1V2_9AGAR|nr:hypothetical protein GGX14DRAFT_471032 [Mycena pura]
MSVDVVRYLLCTEDGRLSEVDHTNLVRLLARLLQRGAPVDGVGRPIPELAPDLIRPRDGTVQRVRPRVSVSSMASTERMWQGMTPFTYEELALADAICAATGDSASGARSDADLPSISSASSLTATISLPQSDSVQDVQDEAALPQWVWAAEENILMPKTSLVVALERCSYVDVLDEEAVLNILPPPGCETIVNPDLQRVYSARGLPQALRELRANGVLAFCRPTEVRGYLAATPAKWLAGPAGI